MESMKRKIYENVKALCLINNMPIGQIEDTIGKCHGFLSRERGDIGISDVCTIAHVFDVSVQDLLSVDFRKAWEDEKALDDFEEAVLKMFDAGFTADEIRKRLEFVIDGCRLEEKG